MLQRIQTIFLIIATGAFATQFFTPLLKSSQTAASGIYQDGQAFTKENQIGLILLAICALISIVAIFFFKNRTLQKQLIILCILVVLASNLFVGYFIMAPTEEIASVSQASIFPGLGSFMPLIAIISLILAYRGVSKDEKIVKSMDRLR